MRKNYDKIAEVLMKDEWFTKKSFNSKMNTIDLLGLPSFEEVRDTLESRDFLAEICSAPLAITYECNLNCALCPYNREYIDTEYHFPDSPSATECQEQIEILKSFHII